MDPQAVERAHRKLGVVARGDLGVHPGRDAGRDRLVKIQPRTYLAATQPYDIRSQLASLHVSHPNAEWTVTGATALWLYDVLELPRVLHVGIPVDSELAIRRPIVCHRLAGEVLRGNRIVKECRVVSLEVAVIQWSVRRPPAEVLAMVEKVVRERRTTVIRLRSRLRRGLSGSAAVRIAIDTIAGGSLERDVRRLRAALERRGVTGLEPEVHFSNAAGASAYADLLHRRTMTAVEVDAALDHLERRRFRADRRRDRWMLREHGARTIRVDVTEIRGDLEGLVDELLWFFTLADAAGDGEQAS